MRLTKMKEILAIIRPDKLEAIIEELEKKYERDFTTEKEKFIKNIKRNGCFLSTALGI